MTRMTPSEIFEFLSSGTRTAHVASTRADGSPHVAPVWFAVAGEPLVTVHPVKVIGEKNLRAESYQ